MKTLIDKINRSKFNSYEIKCFLQEILRRIRFWGPFNLESSKFRIFWILRLRIQESGLKNMLNQNLTFFMNGKFNKLSNEYLIIKIGQFYQQLWNFEQVALFPLDISDMTRIEEN